MSDILALSDVKTEVKNQIDAAVKKVGLKSVGNGGGTWDDDKKGITVKVNVTLDNDVIDNTKTIKVNTNYSYTAGKEEGEKEGWVKGYNAAAAKFYKSSWTVYGPATTSSYGSEPSAHYKVSYTASKHEYTASSYKASSFNGPGTYVASSYTKETHSYTASSCSIGDKQS